MTLGRLVEGERGLGQVRDLLGVGDVEARRRPPGRSTTLMRPGASPRVPIDLLVVGVADEHDVVAVVSMRGAPRGAPWPRAGRWRRSRTGRVRRPRRARPGPRRARPARRWRRRGTSSSSCTNTAPRSSRPAHDVGVVDDLAPDVDRRAVAVEGPLDDGDGPLDAGAERSGAGGQHPPGPDGRRPLLQHRPEGAQRRGRPGARPSPSPARRGRWPAVSATTRTAARRRGSAPARHEGVERTRPTPCRRRRAPAASAGTAVTVHQAG